MYKSRHKINTIKQIMYCLWFIVLFYFSNKFAFNLILFILFYLLIFLVCG